MKLLVYKIFPPPAETPYVLPCRGNPSMETLFFLRALASDDLRQTTEANESMESGLPDQQFIRKPINGEG